MLKFFLLLAVFVIAAYAGHASQGHDHHHSPHGGWGGKKYSGWANVKAWQGPWAYQYALNEKGHGYDRYAWAQQEFSKGWSG